MPIKKKTMDKSFVEHVVGQIEDTDDRELLRDLIRITDKKLTAGKTVSRLSASS